MTGKTWNIPEDTIKPTRKKLNEEIDLLTILKEEMGSKISGGIYYKIQIDLTYNSNRIEGSKLSHDETRYIFETNTIGTENKIHNVDDIIETTNHFRCIDLMIDHANKSLSEKFIKQLHLILKMAHQTVGKVGLILGGGYKQLPNEVGGKATTAPSDVETELKKLINSYNSLEKIDLNTILDFHYQFECIHPFQDERNEIIANLISHIKLLKNVKLPYKINNSFANLAIFLFI